MEQNVSTSKLRSKQKLQIWKRRKRALHSKRLAEPHNHKNTETDVYSMGTCLTLLKEVAEKLYKEDALVLHCDFLVFLL